MSALGRLIMQVIMWGAVVIGLLLAALCGMIFYALQSGSEGGMSTGQNPEIGMAVMGGLALVSFLLAFFLKRELRKSRLAAEAKAAEKLKKEMPKY